MADPEELTRDDPDEIEIGVSAPTVPIGLSLSGGGYRAMLFHLGALLRLNELGVLGRIDRVASVSGGSIIAARLGLVWKELSFENGTCSNFDDLVAKPILDLAGRTVDVPAVLLGWLRPGHISRRVEKAYDRHLYDGKTLQDLPHQGQGPRFIILATNLSNGTLWRMSQPYMRDWRSESVELPTLPLAQAVAASSAFPPVLSPSWLNLPGRPRTFLTDGGVYDNLGLEPILKRCETVLVSDGGGTFAEPEKPPTGWVRGTVRVLNTVDVQVRRLRRRQVISAIASGQRRGAFWAINTDPAGFRVRSPALTCTTEQALALSRTPTRLAKLPTGTRYRIANWGYAAADFAVRTYHLTDHDESTGFPYPGGMG